MAAASLAVDDDRGWRSDTRDCPTAALQARADVSELVSRSHSAAYVFVPHRADLYLLA
jgi:hypothetical protein